MAIGLVVLSLFGGWGITQYAEAQEIPVEKLDEFPSSEEDKDANSHILKTFSGEAVVPIAINFCPALGQFIPAPTFEELLESYVPLPRARIVLSYFSKLFSSCICINAP